MKTLLRCLLALLIISSLPLSAQETTPEPKQPRGDLLIVVGAGGTPELVEQFHSWGRQWVTGGEQGQLRVKVIGTDPVAKVDDRTSLQQALKLAEAESELPLWLVLIGHGSFDGRQTKLNLRGPDVAIEELGTWLQPIRRPLALIGSHSASGSLLEVASGPRRIVISATKNAAEINMSHFGGYLVQALLDPTADLDKDHQVSLLEGFLRASRQTREFYEADGRLETEHALLDDSGDSLGTRAESFTGVTPASDIDPEMADGPRAHQWHLIPSQEELQVPPDIARRRDELELELWKLRRKKQQLGEEAYYAQIEVILRELAKINLGLPVDTPTNPVKSSGSGF